jgi:type IV secretory pathway component VirB8
MTQIGRGSRAERRRRLVALVLVFAMILAVAATVISLALG